MFVSLAALVIAAALGLASWTMISEAARGERWITLSRTTNQRPEAIWQRVEDSWTKTALTFEPVRILPESTVSQKTFTLQVDDHEFRTTLLRHPPGQPRELAITCISANGISYPLGRDHLKIWSVEPAGIGAVVRISVKFNAPPGAIVQAIFTFSRQLRLIAGA